MDTKTTLNWLHIRGCAQRVWRDSSFRHSLFAFTISRLIVSSIFVLTTNLSVIQMYRDPYNGIPTYEAEIPFQKLQVARKLRQIAPHGDAGWYMGIAQGGYEKVPFDATHEHAWAFFPMFPLLIGLIASVTHEYFLTSMFVCTLLLLPALILCHKTIVALGFEETVANRAVFYLAIYPTSYFFSLPMSESLFLLLSAASFCAAARDRWWLAGAMGALASATRPPGILLLPALMILYWERHGLRLERKLAGLMLVPVGLLSYMIYLHRITGNAFAAFQIQQAWGRRATWNLISPFYNYLAGPVMIARPWYLVGFHFVAGVGALVSSAFLLKWRKWALGFYVLAGVLLPLSTSSLAALTRYVMVLFPALIPLAVAGRSPKFDQTIRAIFLVLFGLLSALFAAHFSFTFT